MKNKNKNAIRLSHGDKVYRIICLTILGVFTTMVLYPLWFMLVASFSDPVEIYNTTFTLLPKNPTLNSYQLAFKDKMVLTGFKNSILYTLVGTAVNLIMTIFGAYPLSKKSLKGRNFFTILFTIPMFFGGGLIPTYLLVDSLGLRNNFWVMVIPGAVNTMYIFIMRTFFQTQIPDALEDAAMIDGCSHFNYLFRVLLPLSVPIIAVFGLYYGVGHWNDFFTALIYITDKELYPLQYVLRSMLLQNMDTGALEVATMDTEVARQMMNRFGLKYALMAITTIPVFAIVPVVQKYFSKGVIIGSIKG